MPKSKPASIVLAQKIDLNELFGVCFTPRNMCEDHIKHLIVIKWHNRRNFTYQQLIDPDKCQPQLKHLIADIRFRLFDVTFAKLSLLRQYCQIYIIYS